MPSLFGDRSLAPRQLDRLRVPAWARSTTLRRIVAAALVVIAAVTAVGVDPDAGRVTVVVTSHAVKPGTVLSPSDVSTAVVDASTAPAGALTAVADVSGHTVAGPIGVGEIVTDVRLLGPRLAGAAIDSANPRVVPIRLADAELAEIVRVGDRVDVLTVTDSETSTGRAEPELLAAGATVVLVSDGGDGTRGRERVVLIALDAEAATAVAAASLVSALTVTFH